MPALSRALAETLGRGSDPVSDECKRLVALLRERCPGLLPGDPLPSGQLGPEIPLGRETGGQVFRLVARQVCGLGESDRAGVVVWTQGDDELAVLVDEVSVTTAPGALAVDIPVRCDEVGATTVRVRFALGSDERPAGLVAATDQRPFGPVEVVDVWGEALTAFAWQIVLTTTSKLADASGRDADGAGLVPAALRVTEAGIAVQTIARHGFARKRLP